MKRLLLLVPLLVLALLFTACGGNEDSTDLVPVISWTEAEVTVPIEGLDLGDINTILGYEDDTDWTASDFDIAGSLLPEDDENVLDFDFGTPLELGNTFDDSLPLETGMVLETGTGDLIGVIPIAEVIVEPVEYIPLEVDEEALIAYVEEELEQPGEELPKTNDMFSVLAMVGTVTVLLVLLIVYLKKGRVGA